MKTNGKQTIKLRKALDSVTKMEILVLPDLNSARTQCEVADRLHCSPGSVSVIKARIRKRFRAVGIDPKLLIAVPHDEELLVSICRSEARSAIPLPKNGI